MAEHADQCIVCLEDLDHAPKLEDADPSLVIAKNDLEGTAQQQNNKTPQHAPESLAIAVIKTCNHVLHDVCLKEWTQKANSCPICRTQFNKVEVRESTTGPAIYEYEVKDKKQIADFDPLAWIQEQDQEEEIDRPCPICGTQEDEDQLLLCDACDAPYHTYCVGLDHVPEGHWFCMECDPHEGGNIQAAAATEFEPLRPAAVATRRNRTLAQLRESRSRRRVRANAWEGAWNQIATRVHEATGFDLDYEGQDELQQYRQAQAAHSHIAQEERERREWEQRIRIADRQGAGRQFANNLRSRPAAAYEAPAPPQETEAERRAWATYERERQEQIPGGTSSSRKRKATESPTEPQANIEPERKLKRPRTRRNRPQDNAGSSSEHNTEAVVANGRPASHTSTPRRSPPRTAPAAPAAPAAAAPAPSFLSSLLKEVEESCKGDHNDSDTPHTNGTSPGIEHSSPILSPSTSNYSTPRPLSLTPPPRRSGSPRQTSLSSIVEPIYPIPNPADYSPNRPTPQRSPATPPPHMNGHSSSGIRHPQPLPSRPHRAISGSPSNRGGGLEGLSDDETIKRKEGIKTIVKHALDHHWRSKLTSDQYTTTCRKVCRKLYDRMPDPEHLGAEERRRWDNISRREVDDCVKALGFDRGQIQTQSQPQCQPQPAQATGMASGNAMASGSGSGSTNHNNTNQNENTKPQTPREGVTV